MLLEAPLLDEKEYQAEDPLLDEEEYQTFARALQWLEGFGIFFAVCTPIQAERLIKRVEKDIPYQKIASLVLEESIDNLYVKIEELTQDKPTNILFIQGLEKSLIEYIKSGYGGRGDYYKEDSVPRILGHLNLQRERFRDTFKNTRLVFLLPLFALKYFMLRAPDFFDWRSGLFEFSTEENALKQEITKVLEKDSETYKDLTEKERHQKLLEIQALIDEPQAEEDKIKLYHEHISLLGLNDMFEEAIVSCDKVLQIKENDIQALEKSAYFLQRLGRMEEALEKIDDALKIDNKKTSIWMLHSIILLNLKRTEEAIESAAKLTELEPKEMFSWWFNSFILSVIKKYQDALTSLNKAKKLAPNNRSIWEMRGNIYAALKNYNEALNSYNKAIKLGGNDFEILFKKSLTLLNLKHYESAIESCNEAIQLESDNWLIWAIRADAFTDLEKYEDALIDYDKAIKQKPNNAELWHNKGSTLANLKRYEEALQSYDKALSLSADDTKTLTVRSFTLIELGRYKEAIDSLEKIAKKSDDEDKYWLAYAKFLLNKSGDSKDKIRVTKNIDFGRFIIRSKSYLKAAILILDSVIEKNSTNYDAYSTRSRAKYQSELYESALVDINKAIKLNEDIAYFGQRGLILMLLNRYQEALLDIEKIIKVNPKIYQFWEEKGDCLFSLGNHQEALNSYKQAISLKNDNVDLYLKCAKTELNINIKSALVFINKAVRLEPKNYQAWWLHGLAKALLGKAKKEVLSDLDKAIQLSPDKNFALIEKSKILFTINYIEEAQIDCNKAIQAYSAIIEKDQTNDNAFYNRASCYALLENSKLAIVDLKQAIQLNSDNAIHATNDDDFEKIKDNPDFQVLLNLSEEIEQTTKENITEFKKKNLFEQAEQTADPLLGYIPFSNNKLNISSIEKSQLTL